MSRNSLLVPAVAACLLSAPVWADETPETVAAAWTDKELDFVYQGFTTKYSCDGLRDKMRGVLLDLGADKKSLKVMQSGCTSVSGRPEPFPGVRAKMRVLLPAAADTKQKTVAAHWKPVNLKLSNTVSIDSGECELVEQIQQKVLPLFATRNVDSQTNCIPHQASAARPFLKLEVLVADARHSAAAPPAAQ